MTPMSKADARNWCLSGTKNGEMKCSAIRSTKLHTLNLATEMYAEMLEHLYIRDGQTPTTPITVAAHELSSLARTLG
jgi:hypothetical protein